MSRRSRRNSWTPDVCDVMEKICSLMELPDDIRLEWAADTRAEIAAARARRQSKLALVENSGSDGTGRRPAGLGEVAIRRSASAHALVRGPRRGRRDATCLGCAEVQPGHFLASCFSNERAFRTMGDDR